jgi:hypothetical protein
VSVTASGGGGKGGNGIEVSGFEPRLHEGLERESGGRWGGVLPSKDERDGDGGGEAGEGERGVGWDYPFGDHSEANTGFDVGEYCADQAGRTGEDRGESGVSASGEDGIVDSDPFSPSENDEFFSLEC